MTATCLNCGESPSGQFCQCCGQRVDLQPLTVRSLLAEVPRVVFDVDRGVWFTLMGLLRRPGDVINGYLDGRRVRYTNPFVLLLLFTGFSAALYSRGWLNFAGLIGVRGKAPQEDIDAMQLLFEYSSLRLLVQLPVTSAITRLCFAAGHRNYAEHLVMNAYTSAVASVFMTVLFPLLMWLNDTVWFGWVWNSVPLMILLYDGFAFVKVFDALLGRGTSVRRAIGATALKLLSTLLMFALPLGLYFLHVARRQA